MFSGKPDLLDRVAQILVLAVGLFALLLGIFMIIWPLDWYTALPTVITTGPPNKHFIRDIGIAYASCGIILLYASAHLHMRWMAALTGGLWLSLHGVLHIYEVSVGICSPDVFVADAPGVLGPPILVLAAVGILLARQRVAPSGLPKGALLRAIDRLNPGESEYMRDVAAAPGRAFEKMMHFAPAANHRYAAPADLFHAARIGATLAEDCGPCALTAAGGALADGVPKAQINRFLRGDVSGDFKTAFDFGRAIATQDDQAAHLGERLEEKYGRAIRFELAMTAAVVRAYPAMKRGLGLTRSCAVTPLEI